MRKTIPAALVGGALTLAATVGAAPASAVEPTLSWGTAFGGTSLNHFTTAPASALFDGDIGTLTPAVQPGILGVLADTAGGHCVSAQFAFYPKDGGAVEIVPVGTSCGVPIVYTVTASRPAGDYADVCGQVTTAPYQTNVCLRFPND